MPYNGSGVFSIVNSFVPGTVIFSSAVNANFTDIATGLSTAVLKNGTQTITANIAMSGFGFTGVGGIQSQAVITVASATTTDILAQSSLLIAISGVATITSFGADAASRRNQIKFVRATGAFTITYNGTSLITPTAADIVCASGDTFIVISDASSNARIYAFQRASGYPVISAPGFRNIARRNGGLEIWQRGAGGAASFALAASAGATYTADGWYFNNGANEASVVSQQAGLSDGSQWCVKVIRNSGQTGTGNISFGFPFDTDEIYPCLNQFVRLSFVAKCGANYSQAFSQITVRLEAGTGTPVKQVAGYTGGTTPISSTVVLSTTATRFQISSSVVVPTTTRQMEIRFVFTPVGTAGADDSFYIDDVQLEIVPDASQGASPFERLNFQEQLELCKRHYQKTFPYATAPAQNAGVAIGTVFWFGISATAPNFSFWNLPVPLRLATTATCTTYNPSATNIQIRNQTDGADFTNTIASQLNESVIEPGGTVNAGMSASDQIAVHVTADAGI